MHHGARRTLARAAYDLAQRAAGVRIVDCLRLEREKVRPAEARGSFEARWLGRDDILALAADPRRRLDWSWRALAFARGDACLGLFDGDRLASFTWYATGPSPVLADQFLHFGDDWVYHYHAFTLPEYRGRLLNSHGKTLALDHFAREGYRGFLTCIERFNYAAKRASWAMGFKECGSLYRITFAGRTRAWAGASCAEAGIFLVPGGKA